MEKYFHRDLPSSVEGVLLLPLFQLMCLTLRFPLISGIKTGDDISVRIQCRPQQQLLSHVKQLQLKPSHLK